MSDGFSNTFEVALDEIVPTGSDTGAGLRTVKLEDGNVVQYTGEDSPYQVIVRRLVAIDGLAKPSSPGTSDQPMSLIVLEYDLTSEGDYKTVKTELRFSDLPNTPNDQLAKPKIVGYAPFYTATQWQPSTEDIKVIKNLQLELSGGMFVNAKIAPSIGTETSKTLQYFSKGIAMKRYTGPQKDHLSGIKWVLTQNPSAPQGTPKTFRTAVLLQRTTTSTPIHISYKFECSINALRDARNTIYHWFDSGLNQSALITYTPSDTGRSFEEGDQILAKLQPLKDNLGVLAGNHVEMAALTPVWGLEPGIKS